MANRFSTVANHAKDVHFMDFELKEFDVWTFVVVSGPSTPTWRRLRISDLSSEFFGNVRKYDFLELVVCNLHTAKDVLCDVHLSICQSIGLWDFLEARTWSSSSMRA